MTAVGTLDRALSSNRTPKERRRKTGVIVFLLWFGALTAWSLATPVWASPDEFQHAFRAYSAAHGQLYVAPAAAVRGTGGFVDVPRGWLGSVHHYRCYFARNVDASCVPPLTNDNHPVRVASAAARYNPLYYLVVGSVTLFSSPAHAVRLMRLVSAALSAIFLAWALTAALTARRPALAASAVLMAATPMVLFLGSAINPNGLEITAAMCAWVCGFQAFVTADRTMGRTLLRRTAVALVVVVETRAISPLWAVIILTGLLVSLANRPMWTRYHREFKRWGLTLAAAICLAGGWSVLARASQLEKATVGKPSSSDSWNLAWDGGLNQLRWWRGTVGNFGWLNTGLAPNVTDIWLFVAAGLLLLCLRVGSRREKGTLVALGAVVVLVPTGIAAMDWNRYGGFWQARYTMPISLGLVLLSGLAVARSKHQLVSGNVTVVVATALTTLALLTDLIGFVVALSRYSVGPFRRISITGHWQPPSGGPFVTLVETACLIGLAWTIARPPLTASSPATGSSALPLVDEVTRPTRLTLAPAAQSAGRSLMPRHVHVEQSLPEHDEAGAAVTPSPGHGGSGEQDHAAVLVRRPVQ